MAWWLITIDTLFLSSGLSVVTLLDGKLPNFRILESLRTTYIQQSVTTVFKKSSRKDASINH